MAWHSSSFGDVIGGQGDEHHGESEQMNIKLCTLMMERMFENVKQNEYIIRMDKIYTCTNIKEIIFFSG